MAEGNVTTSQYAVATILAYWRNLLNTGSTLRLWTQPITVTPLTVWSDLTEASFTGYSAASLAGQFQVPTNPDIGEFQTAVLTQIFGCTGGPPQVCYGAAILDSSLNLWFTYPFPAPIEFASGASWSVQIDLFEWAAILIP